jgi:hypothetical protein
MDNHEAGAPLPYHVIDVARMMHALTGGSFSVSLNRPLPTEKLGWTVFGRRKLGMSLDRPE